MKDPTPFDDLPLFYASLRCSVLTSTLEMNAQGLRALRLSLAGLFAACPPESEQAKNAMAFILQLQDMLTYTENKLNEARMIHNVQTDESSSAEAATATKH